MSKPQITKNSTSQNIQTSTHHHVKKHQNTPKSTNQNIVHTNMRFQNTKHKKKKSKWKTHTTHPEKVSDQSQVRGEHPARSRNLWRPSPQNLHGDITVPRAEDRQGDRPPGERSRHVVHTAPKKNKNKKNKKNTNFNENSSARAANDGRVDRPPGKRGWNIVHTASNTNNKNTHKNKNRTHIAIITRRNKVMVCCFCIGTIEITE